MPEEITNRPCSICDLLLWRVWVSTPAGLVEVLACARCDRAHCRVCGVTFGALLAPHRALASLDDDTSLCPPCSP